MNPSSSPSESGRMQRTLHESHRIVVFVMALFIGFFLAAVFNQLGNFWLIQPRLNATLVILAFVASIAAFAPMLPWLNVLLAAGLAAFIGGIAHAVGAVTGFPFGRLEFTPNAGPLVAGLIPWWLPVTWAVIALSARGSARLVLHRSRQHPKHGYHVILLATGLAVIASIGLHVFAVRSAQLWDPNPTQRFSYAGYALHLFIQIAITPLLIDKFPGSRPANFRPLIVWGGVNVLLVAGWLLS